MSSDLILHKLNILWERKCCLSLSVLTSRTHCSPCRIWPLNEFYEWAKWIVIDDLIFTWKYNAKTWKCAQESIKLNHANLLHSWRKVCLYFQLLYSLSFSRQQLVCVSGAVVMNWGKELELSLCDCTCLRVLSKTAWEQVPAVFESCLIKWEGGNRKSREFISCISSHQKGRPAGHISTSSSVLVLRCVLYGNTLPANSSKTQGRENICIELRKCMK